MFRYSVREVQTKRLTDKLKGKKKMEGGKDQYLRRNMQLAKCFLNLISPWDKPIMSVLIQFKSSLNLKTERKIERLENNREGKKPGRADIPNAIYQATRPLAFFVPDKKIFEGFYLIWAWLRSW